MARVLVPVLTVGIGSAILPTKNGDAAASLSVLWRGCAGVEEGLLVSEPSLRRLEHSVAPVAAALKFAPAMAGRRATVIPVQDAEGRARWLVRLKPPASARPGRYTGQIEVRRGGGSARLACVVEVLPFALMRPSKQYAVTRVPVTAAECCPIPAAGMTELRALREIGIGSLCLDRAPGDRSVLEESMRAAGLHGPVLMPLAGSEKPDTAAARPRSARVGPTIHWYGLGSSDRPSSEALSSWKAAGGKVAGWMDRGETPPAPPVDLPIYGGEGSQAERLLARHGPLGGGTVGWWHWDAGRATPLENRLRCGALLWKSGLSGALLEIQPDRAADPAWPLRWEGARQGVLDSRYLTTLFSLIRQVRDMDRSNRMPAQAEEAVTAALNLLAKQPSTEAADRFRGVVITWILHLHQVVGA